MLSNFSFKRYKDRYYLNNTGSTLFNFTLEIKNNCDSNYTLVMQGTALAAELSELFINKDGAYRLLLVRPLMGGGSTEEQTIYFKHYLRLQKDLIYNTLQVLCNGNPQCDDCEDDDSQQALINQILGYQYLVKPYTEDYCDSNCLFDKFLYEALEQSNCDLSGRIYTNLTKQLYTGKIETDNTTLQIFASVYMSAFYYFEHLLAVDSEEREYVESKFFWPRASMCMRKYINCFSDIEGIFTGISQVCNEAPSVTSIVKSFVDLEYQEEQEVYTFLDSDFLGGYSDPNGDLPNKVKILYVPFRGQLYYNNVQVTQDNFIFDAANINLLTYRFYIQETTTQFDRIFFQVSDINPSPKYSNMANIAISVTEYVNKPPTVVGDNAFTLANRAVKVFTVADFSTQTTPPFADPENDPLNAIRIDSLPVAGQLQLNNSACFSGQIVLASEIAGGLFKYIAPDQNTANTVNFLYSARDSGSMIFVS